MPSFSINNNIKYIRLLVVLCLCACGGPKEGKIAVKNSKYDGSVMQVVAFLKTSSALREPDSYEPISWGQVASLTQLKKDNYLQIRKLKKAFRSNIFDTIINFKKGQEIYVRSLENEKIKFTQTPSDSSMFSIDSSMTTFYANGAKINGDYFVWHEFRSKNGFGGYESTRMNFWLDSDGNVLTYEEVK